MQSRFSNKKWNFRFNKQKSTVNIKLKRVQFLLWPKYSYLMCKYILSVLVKSSSCHCTFKRSYSVYSLFISDNLWLSLDIKSTALFFLGQWEQRESSRTPNISSFSPSLLNLPPDSGYGLNYLIWILKLILVDSNPLNLLDPNPSNSMDPDPLNYLIIEYYVKIIEKLMHDYPW